MLVTCAGGPGPARSARPSRRSRRSPPDGDADGAERDRHHHPRPVLARRTMDQRGTPGLRDAAQRRRHLIGTVFQIAQVVPADGIGGVTGPVAVNAGQQHVTGRIGRRSRLGEHRMVKVQHARDAIQRRRALGRQLVRAAQVHHGRQADLAHQRRDVRRRQFLQVVTAQQPGIRGLAAVLGGQPAQVAHVDGPVQFDPRHDAILAAPAAGPAGSNREPAVNSCATAPLHDRECAQALGRLGLHRDIGHDGVRGAAARPGHQAVNILGPAFEDRLDLAIGKIAHPPGHPVLTRHPPTAVTEEDALHPARDQHPVADHNQTLRRDQ